jgi:hypothetical protein
VRADRQAAAAAAGVVAVAVAEAGVVAVAAEAADEINSKI